MRVLLVLLAFNSLFIPTKTLASDVLGLWRTEPTEQGTLEVRVSTCGQKVCGVIETARDPNGDVASYPHIGKYMIWDMTPNGEDSWNKGKIWDPRNDRTFSSKMAVSGDQLTVSGCLLGLCRTQVWVKVN